MAKGSGTPRRMTVKDIKTGKVIGTFNSVEKARQAFYPEKAEGYISAKLYQAKQDYYTDYDLGVSFFRGGEGKYDCQKKYKVVDRRTGREKIYKKSSVMLKELRIGNSFNKQMRVFGNFKNDYVEIYKIS